MGADTRNVLVTGGSGLIGSRVVGALAPRVDTVVTLDRNAASREGLADRVVQVEGDLTDRDLLVRLVQEHGIGRVIHLGSILSLEAGRDAARAIHVNSVGTAILLDVAESEGVERVVWASSTGLYGTRLQYEELLGRHRVDESDPVMPGNLYVATKQLNEVLAGSYRARGLDVVGLRPVLTYGEGVTTTAAGIINAALADLALSGRAHVTDPWARSSRINVMHADDCADLFVELTLHGGRLAHDVYNAGTGEYASIGEMLEQAAVVVGGGSVTFESMSAQGQGSALGVPIYDFPDVDSSRVREELGWTPRHDFASGAAAVMASARHASAGS